MITFAKVREWDASALDEMLTRLDRSAGQIMAKADDFRRAQPFDSWEARSAEPAAAKARELVRRLEDAEEAMVEIRRSLAEAKCRVLKLHCQVRNVESLAASKGLRILDDGKPVPKGDLSGFIDLIKGGTFFAYWEVEGEVNKILEEALDIDADTSRQFGRAAAALRGNTFDETLLRDFRVSEDTRTPGWQGVLWNLLPVSDLNHAESELFFDLTRAERVVVGWVKFHSEQVAIDRFADEGGDGEYYDYYEGGAVPDDRTDAFRHAFASAMLTQYIGPEFAEKFTTAHEQSGGNSATAHAMDLHNNAVGRAIAESAPTATADQLANLVSEAVWRGDLSVVSEAGDLVRSDHSISRPDAPGVERPHQVW
ncbi:DUF6973 domain-containing protein [Lentzea cavernae]|uniref:DUF6973 domain-containing protein n=1 Tax=Lentzea cavernae TaxID=2020703 RepID=A0ABQ3M710_9PSEU|nr:hypothetical protein [Lentzea cavernae]GHH34685.1 hypothetical protein GCM10017774_19060 [Lentzea cavernae]